MLNSDGGIGTMANETEILAKRLPVKLSWGDRLMLRKWDDGWTAWYEGTDIETEGNTIGEALEKMLNEVTEKDTEKVTVNYSGTPDKTKEGELLLCSPSDISRQPVQVEAYWDIKD